MVTRSSVRSVFSVFGPTPQRRDTGSGARNAITWSGATSFCPAGFARSEAIFATNFTLAIPADEGSPTSAAIRFLSVAAISAAAPKSEQEAVTSRNASSSDSGSTRGVTCARMANTSALAAA
jgi:hypothetical protein